MSHQSLKSFIDLVTFDLRFVDLQNKISKLVVAMQTTEQQQQLEQENFAKIAVRHKDLQKLRHEQELRIAELVQQEEHLLQQIEKSTSSREHGVAMKELDALRVTRNQQEQKLLQYMNKADAFVKEIEHLSQQHQQELQALQDKLAAEQASLAAMQQELKDVEHERSAKIVGIPQEWISMYELMRGRVADPVVPLLQDSCSACFYGITPRDLQMIRSKSLIQCKDCYRFLYEEPVA